MKVYQLEERDGALYALLRIEPQEVPTGIGGTVGDAQLEEAIANAVISLANAGQFKLMYTTVNDIDEQDDGSVMFSLEAVLAPKVSLGPYKELYVRPKPDELFEDAALSLAAQFVDTEIPGLLVEKELESMVAGLKADLFLDPYLNILSDIHAILSEVIRRSGAALDKDTLWQYAMETAGEEAGLETDDLTAADIHCSLLDTLERHGLGWGDLSDAVEMAAEKRAEDRENTAPEDMACQIFNAYLRRLGKTEEQWRDEMVQRAVDQARIHLMLDAIAEKEQLTVSDAELEEELIHLSRQYKLSVEETRRQIDVEAVRYHMTREKAKQLVVESSKRISGWSS